MMARTLFRHRHRWFSESTKAFDHHYNYYKDLGFDKVPKEKYHTITVPQIKQACYYSFCRLFISSEALFNDLKFTLVFMTLYTDSRLVKECHPDTNPDINHVEAAKRLEILKRAYSVLSNYSMKSEYDQYHRAPFQSVPFHSMRLQLQHDAALKEKAKDMEASRSFHERLQDKTYQFNYYADKHKKGGMRANKVDTMNEVGYEEFVNQEQKMRQFKNEHNENIWNKYQDALQTLGLFVMIGTAVCYVTYDLYLVETSGGVTSEDRDHANSDVAEMMNRWTRRGRV